MPKQPRTSPLNRFGQKRERLGSSPHKEKWAQQWAGVKYAGYVKDYKDASEKSVGQFREKFKIFGESLGLKLYGKDQCTDDSLPLHDRIWSFHYHKKLTGKKSLFRSELYWALSGNTDYHDHNNLNDYEQDVAFCLELFDMITYIENDVYDIKNGFKPGTDDSYFALTKELENAIETILSKHGDDGRKALDIIQLYLKQVKDTQEAIINDSGIMNLCDERFEKLSAENHSEYEKLFYEEYDKRVRGFDTVSIAAQLAAVADEKSYPSGTSQSFRIGTMLEFAELLPAMQKLNDAADLNSKIKRNTGADFRKGELTPITY